MTGQHTQSESASCMFSLSLSDGQLVRLSFFSLGGPGIDGELLKKKVSSFRFVCVEASQQSQRFLFRF